MNSADYKYTGRVSECKYDSEKTVFKNLGMVQEANLSNDKLKALVSKQPISAGIWSNENFRFYKEGILTEEFL